MATPLTPHRRSLWDILPTPWTLTRYQQDLCRQPMRRRSQLCQHRHHDGDRRRDPCHHRCRRRRILPSAHSGQFGHQQDLRSQRLLWRSFLPGCPNGTVSVIDGGDPYLQPAFAAGVNPRQHGGQFGDQQNLRCQRMRQRSSCQQRDGDGDRRRDPYLHQCWRRNCPLRPWPSTPRPTEFTSPTIAATTSCHYDDTVSVIDGTPPTALQFVPLTQPCRAVDTRPENGGGGPIQGGTYQDFAISGAGTCGTLPSAAAYSMNVSVVPQRTSGLPDGVARGTAAAFGFDVELAGWPHQGQRGDRAGGHQRRDQRVRHQHDQCDRRRQWLLRAGVWFHAGFLSADAVSRRRHAQEQFSPGPGTAVLDWRPGTRTSPY